MKGEGRERKRERMKQGRKDGKKEGCRWCVWEGWMDERKVKEEIDRWMMLKKDV